MPQPLSPTMPRVSPGSTVKAVDGLHVAHRAAQEALLDGEVLLEVPHLEQRRAFFAPGRGGRHGGLVSVPAHGPSAPPSPAVATPLPGLVVFGVEEAARGVVRADLDLRRPALVANAGDALRAAGGERAAALGGERARYVAGDRHQLFERTVDARDRAPQRLGVGVLGVVEDVVRAGVLHHHGGGLGCRKGRRDQDEAALVELRALFGRQHGTEPTPPRIIGPIIGHRSPWRTLRCRSDSFHRQC